LKVYKGSTASPGIIIGEVKKFMRPNPLELVPGDCTTMDKDEEISQIENAIAKIKKRFEKMKEMRSEKELVEVLDSIAEAIAQEAIEYVSNQNICASLAVKKVYEKYAEMLKGSSSQLFSFREADIRVVAEFFLTELLGLSREKLVEDFRDKIVVSDELGISDLLEFTKLGIRGLITRYGGITSHVAIVARNNRIPYVIVQDLDIDNLKEDEYIIVDALNGVVITEPDESTLREFEKKAENYRRAMEEMLKFAHEEAYTLDKYNVKVFCNVGDLEEARLASTLGCDGIGLFRIEFLYMKNEPPEVNELREVFEKTALFFKNKPVVIRAPDIGGDKRVPYIDIKEENPFLGLRGIRLLLEYKDELFKPFIRAFLEAFKNYSNLRLLLPMVSRVSEVNETVELIDEIAKEIDVDVSKLEIGVMIEAPSSALMIDKIASTGRVRFVSYGTNDLTQYVLAVDRTNPKVGAIYDDMDPSVLRLLNISMSEARKHGLGVEVCGELASRQLAVPVLLSFGVNALSVNLSSVGLVKYTIRGIDLGEVESKILPEVLNADSSKNVREVLGKYFVSKNVVILG